MHVLLLSLLLSLLLQAPVVPTTEQVGRAYFLFLQGRAFDQADQLDQAMARYHEALQIMPDAAEIHAELANLYARQDKIADARTAAERALTLNPRSRSAHRILGLIQASQVRTASPEAAGPLRRDAIGHLERVLAGGVQDLAAQFTLGELYLRNGQAAQAIATLEAFLAERPGYPQAMMLLADAYRAAGKTNEADAMLTELQPREGLSALAPDRARADWRVADAGATRLRVGPHSRIAIPTLSSTVFDRPRRLPPPGPPTRRVRCWPR